MLNFSLHSYTTLRKAVMPTKLCIEFMSIFSSHAILLSSKELRALSAASANKLFNSVCY